MDFTSVYTRLDCLRDELSQHRPLTQGELERLREDFMIQFTYNSNAIEGNTMTLDETAVVIREGVTVGGKSIREHLEIVGHRDAYLYVEELVREKAELSETLIKNIHTLVLADRKEDCGVYRRLPVIITGSPAEIPQPWEVPIRMEELLREYRTSQQQLHPVERAARFHLLFESIHPFIDGNGRTGRLLLNLELMMDGYPPIDVKFTDRIKYVNAFRPWHLEQSADQMIALVGDYVEQRLVEYLGYVQMAEEYDREQKPLEPEL